MTVTRGCWLRICDALMLQQQHALGLTVHALHFLDCDGCRCVFVLNGCCSVLARQGTRG